MSQDDRSRASKTLMQIALESVGFILDESKKGKKNKNWKNKNLNRAPTNNSSVAAPKQKRTKPNRESDSMKPYEQSGIIERYVSPTGVTVTRRIEKIQSLGPKALDLSFQKAPNDTNFTLSKSSMFPPISFNKASSVSPDVLVPSSVSLLHADYTTSFRTQLYNGERGLADLVLGLDFGTSLTKVVLMEQGSKNAFAVPFTYGSSNPYLIASNIFLKNGVYRLSGDDCDIQDNLKLPLLLKSYDSEHICHAAAFLALVIRQAREWFLRNYADSYSGMEFEWFYQMGVPAADYSDQPTIELFKKILYSAVVLSRREIANISTENVKEVFNLVLQTTDKEVVIDNVYLETMKVIPEITAQLHGYLKSERWDKNRIKFMLVDVGGGTVDASIVNVTDATSSSFAHNTLKTVVSPLGAIVLDKARCSWIRQSLQPSEERERLCSDVDRVSALSNLREKVPNTERNYLRAAEFPDNFSLDRIFYQEYSNVLWKDLIMDVKSSLDREVEQWRSLQFLLCGGGSNHPLYKKFVENVNSNTNYYVNLDLIQLEKPEGLVAPQLPKEDYHRMSVAYGLSYLDLGKYVDPLEIKEMGYDREIEVGGGTFVTKDMC